MFNYLTRTANSAKVIASVALLGVLVVAGSTLAMADPPVPAPTITSSPATATNATAASFSFSDSKAGVTFQCALDNGAFAGCTSPKAYTVGAGSHTFRVRAVSGAKTSSTTEYTWVVDTTPPPAPAITAKPANPSDPGNQSFSFSDSEHGVSFQCALDGGAFVSCATPKAYSNLAPGSHSFAVKARDAAGNLSSATGYGWTVLPATPSITFKPPDPANQTGASFSFTDSTPGVGFQCALDSAAFSPCTSPKSYTSLGQGSHTFKVRAVSGAYASSPASYSWTVDTVAPPAPWIFLQPSDPSRSRDARFMFLDSELDSSYLCRLDGGSWEPCLLVKTYLNLGQGSHTFSVKARDAAGNIGAPASFTWTIDSIAPPKPVLTQTPPNPAPSTTGTFAWTDAESGVGFQCQVDGNTTWTACTSPRTISVGAGSDTHQFRVRARDAAGNTSDVTSYSWTVSVSQDLGFTVSGSPDGVLTPGTWRTLPLQISNPNNFTIYVTGLTVAVSSSPAGCAASTNLELEQSGVSASQTVTVPANGTAVVPAALRPRLRLKNLPVNQDACKTRTFGLSYSGSATK